MNRNLVALIPLLLLLLPSFTLAAWPTEEEIKSMQFLCTAGAQADRQSMAFKADLDAKIVSWREANAGVSTEAAKANLNGIFAAFEDEAKVSEFMKVYNECVADALDKFVKAANTQGSAGPPPGELEMVRRAFIGHSNGVCDQSTMEPQLLQQCAMQMNQFHDLFSRMGKVGDVVYEGPTTVMGQTVNMYTIGYEGNMFALRAIARIGQTGKLRDLAWEPPAAVPTGNVYDPDTLQKLCRRPSGELAPC